MGIARTSSSAFDHTSSAAATRTAEASVDAGSEALPLALI